MKKTILTLFFIFCFVFVFGQKENLIKKTQSDSLLAKKEVNLIGKWKLDSAQYLELNGNITKQKFTTTWTFVFFENNNFKEESYGSKEVSNKYTTEGKWKIENGTLILVSDKSRKNKGGPAMPFIVEKLTEEKFICSQEATLETLATIYYFIRVK